MSNLRPVVLSGGSGTRLWPLSTPERPKQFVPLFEGRSLFELTLSRLHGLPDATTPIVVTGSAHASLVRDSLANAGVESGWVVVEPVGRNTAPAAVVAALVAEPDDILVIVPSDHLISNVAAFQSAVQIASDHAMEGGIIAFGVRPSRAETGYGYIEVGRSHRAGAYAVARFKEKPDAAEAAILSSDGRHVWNSGMFVARADHLLAEARMHCPGIVDGVTGAIPANPSREGAIRVTELDDSFGTVEATSIDYAIMERTEKALVIPIDVGWDDVGSYQSLLAALDRDGDGNHIEGSVTIREVSGSLIRATSRAVAVAGLSDIVVVETPEAVLVVPLERSQMVREMSERADQD